MPFVYNLAQLKQQNTVVALGNFDGLHLGHRAVIDQMLDAAGDAVPVVLKFREHPALSEGAKPFLLMSEEDCEKKLREHGILVLTYDYSAVCFLSPEEFVEQILQEELRAVTVSCGYNYRFGKDAAGDADTLRSLCEQRGIKVLISPEVRWQGESVCSTAIRKALLRGDMETANGMLGDPYSYDYTVVLGDQRGRLLGAPTINQFFPENLLIPRYGVYASIVQTQGKTYAAVTNIGLRPTIGHSKPRSETYIEGFRGDLYGKNPKVSLLKYMRPEIKFQSLEQLGAQIAADAKLAEQIAEAYL